MKHFVLKLTHYRWPIDLKKWMKDALVIIAVVVVHSPLSRLHFPITIIHHRDFQMLQELQKSKEDGAMEWLVIHYLLIGCC